MQQQNVDEILCVVCGEKCSCYVHTETDRQTDTIKIGEGGGGWHFAIPLSKPQKAKMEKSFVQIPVRAEMSDLDHSRHHEQLTVGWHCFK